MTSSSYIAVKFGPSIVSFIPIAGQQKDDNLCGVQKVLLQTFLLIRLAGSKSGKVTGLVILDASYKNQLGVMISFDEDDTPLDKYDPLVTQETEAW